MSARQNCRSFAFMLILLILNLYISQIESNSECRDIEVPCANGNGCLHISYMCNGNPECTDGSDENPEICKANCFQRLDMFKCDDNSCINKNLLCNGINNCRDGSDEKIEICARNCTSNPLKTRCKNGKCLERYFYCDSVLDCGEDDNTDEDPLLCDNNCGGYADRFQCDNKKCITKYKTCDGVIDCSDGSDESALTCANCNADPDRFKCRISGRCIWISNLCNGLNDCSVHGKSKIALFDNSDEQNCDEQKPEPKEYTYSVYD